MGIAIKHQSSTVLQREIDGFNAEAVLSTCTIIMPKVSTMQKCVKKVDCRATKI